MRLFLLWLLFGFLLAARGGMEPDPPPLIMERGTAPYFSVCADIDPDPTCD